MDHKDIGTNRRLENEGIIQNQMIQWSDWEKINAYAREHGFKYYGDDIWGDDLFIGDDSLHELVMFFLGHKILLCMESIYIYIAVATSAGLRCATPFFQKNITP